jgi:hypothetical protein
LVQGEPDARSRINAKVSSRRNLVVWARLAHNDTKSAQRPYAINSCEIAGRSIALYRGPRSARVPYLLAPPWDEARGRRLARLGSRLVNARGARAAVRVQTYKLAYESCQPPLLSQGGQAARKDVAAYKRGP